MLVRLGKPETADAMFDEMMANLDDLTDENGVGIQVVYLKDATLPDAFFRAMKKMKMMNLHSIKDFPVRDNDVFVLDYAKSGTVNSLVVFEGPDKHMYCNTTIGFNLPKFSEVFMYCRSIIVYVN